MCEGCILGKQKKKGQFRETGQSTKARKTGAGSLISVNYFGSYWYYGEIRLSFDSSQI
jgi:hypothetical protein